MIVLVCAHEEGGGGIIWSRKCPYSLERERILKSSQRKLFTYPVHISWALAFDLPATRMFYRSQAINGFLLAGLWIYNQSSILPLRPLCQIIDLEIVEIRYERDICRNASCLANAIERLVRLYLYVNNGRIYALRTILWRRKKWRETLLGLTLPEKIIMFGWQDGFRFDSFHIPISKSLPPYRCFGQLIFPCFALTRFQATFCLIVAFREQCLLVQLSYNRVYIFHLLQTAHEWVFKICQS